jgi:hypothetical protein
MSGRGRTPAGAPAKRPAFEMVQAPNKLKELVGDTKFDEGLLEKAEQAAKAMAESVDLALACKGDIERLTHAVDAMVAGDGDSAAHERDIYHVMHDLRGQGASFGYPLVTRIAVSLNHYLDSAPHGKRGRADIDVIRAHVDAVRAVLMQRLKGETGAIGLEIAKGLEAISGIRVEGA